MNLTVGVKSKGLTQYCMCEVSTWRHNKVSRDWDNSVCGKREVDCGESLQEPDVDAEANSWPWNVKLMRWRCWQFTTRLTVEQLFPKPGRGR